jgi:hypothetical protein
MNAFSIAFLLVAAGALLALPRHWAPLPLLAGACYMTLGQGINLGPLAFTVIRILVVVGVMRVVFRNERIAGGMNGLDKGMVVFAVWAVISSVFHDSGTDGSPLVFRLGLAFNTCGIYFLIRVFCQSFDDVVHLMKIVGILLVPVALEMLVEQVTARNMFSYLGGVPDSPAIRDGRLRAQGPFTHSILAGTVGAVSFPFMVGLWRDYRRIALAGGMACLVIVVSCASSGPIMSLLAAGFALIMWRYKHLTRAARYAAVAGYIALDIVMKAPAYFLIARANIVGGSTGFHRAELIHQAINHIGEWWLGGTDYTRHWMPTGVSWSPNHTDITNYYIKMGVVGGLPLMILLMVLFWIGFVYVGKVLEIEDDGGGSVVDGLLMSSRGDFDFSA